MMLIIRDLYIEKVEVDYFIPVGILFTIILAAVGDELMFVPMCVIRLVKKIVAKSGVSSPLSLTHHLTLSFTVITIILNL